MLDQRPQAVAVGRDQDPLTPLNRGSDRLIPVRKKSCDRVFQTFSQRQFIWPKIGVAGIAAREALIIMGNRGRPDIIAATPCHNLLLAVAPGRFRLIEALQCPVMAFVEPPAGMDRNPHEVYLLQNDPERLDRALEQGRKCHIKDISFLLQRPSGLDRLPNSFLADADVDAPGEAILFVPFALAMADQHQSLHLDLGSPSWLILFDTLREQHSFSIPIVEPHACFAPQRAKTYANSTRLRSRGFLTWATSSNGVVKTRP